MGSSDDTGNNDTFLIPFESCTLRVIASDGMGWAHVSVSLPNRLPNWREMCCMQVYRRNGEPLEDKFVEKKGRCILLEHRKVATEDIRAVAKLFLQRNS